MSLINQMLQDLEKRRASGAERGALPDQVRVLPRRESNSTLRWLVGIGVTAASIALLAWHFNGQQAVTAAPPLAEIPAPATPLIARNGPASRLAQDIQALPPPTQTPLGNVAPTRPAAVEPHITRKQSSHEDKPAPREEPVRALVSIASVVKPELPASVTPLPPVIAKANPFFPEPLKPSVSAPAAPINVAAASPVPKPAEKAVEKAPGAPATNPQIDKRSQSLTPHQFAENEYREAANFLNQGRSAEAQDGFRRALQSDPSHGGARQALLGVLIDAKKTSEAEQLLHEGLAINPNQPGLAMALSSLQYERGNITEAIETMQRSAPAAQASPDYLARLAGLLQRQSRHREAVESYQAALRLAPGSGVWLMGMGISLQALNRSAEAQDAFRRARNSNSLTPELQAFVDQRLKQLQ